MADKRKQAEAARLWKELEQIEEDDYKKKISLCDQILRQLPNDLDAIQIKAVSLINLSKFEEAVALFTNENLKKELAFERAYAFYRLNRMSDAEEALQKAEKTEAIEHLLAQTAHKSEKYKESAEMYKAIVEQEREEDLDSELLCNVMSSSLYCEGPLLTWAQALINRHLSWDTCFNLANSHIQSKNWKDALNLLDKAAEMCKVAAQKQEWDANQLKDELAIISTQKAYVLLQLNQIEDSVALMKSVLDQKPTSVQANSVASNNLAAVNKNKDLFDSYKKLKQATQPGIESKLTRTQRETFRYNSILITMQMNKGDACRSACDVLRQQLPQSDIGPILLAALHVRENKPSKAEDVLKSFIKQCTTPEQSLRATLTLAQIQLDQGQVGSAINTLAQIPNIAKYPGLLATLVGLYQKTNQTESAINLIGQSITLLQKQPKNTDSSEKLSMLFKMQAECKYKEKKYQEAADVYRKAMEMNPNDGALISGLIMSQAKVDPDAAEALLTKLPNVGFQRKVESIMGDPEALENIPLPTKPQDPKKVKDEVTKKRKADENKSKKKKKQKIRHPAKVMDGNPDPERWIRLKDRSTYRAKKGKKKTQKK